MTTCRIQKPTSKGWTQAPNDLMRDPRIKAVSKVIYVLIAGFSSGYEFTRKTLESMSGSKRDAVQAALRELENHGYLARERQRNDLGRWEYSYRLLTPETTAKPVQSRPVTAAPVPDRPVPVKPASLRRPDLKEHKPKNHSHRARAASDAQSPVVELQGLFKKHNRPVTAKFVNDLILETQARGAQTHDVLSVTTEVLSKFRRASPRRVVEYVLERVGREVRRVSELAVGRNTYDHSRTRAVRVLTDEEAMACIPF